MNETTHDFNENFPALTVSKIDGRFSLSVENTNINTIDKNEIIIKVMYSSINYKDRLVCKGNPGLVRRFPHVVGIDAVGIVSYSQSTKFKVGDEVMVIATPLGIKCPGGLARFVKVPEHWVMHVPSGLTGKEVASLGTAGYTAALAVYKLGHHVTLNDANPIVITGASGGVGLISAFLLLARGARVELVSSNPSLNSLFSNQTNVNLVSFDEFIQKPSLPLLKPLYGGGIDNLGGEALSIISRSLNENAKVCSIGMTQSENINMSIMPFLLRGIDIIGINAETNDEKTRQNVWHLIEELLSQIPINKITHECSLISACNYLKNEEIISSAGRILVNMEY